MAGLWCIQTILTVLEITGAYLFASYVSQKRIYGCRKWSLMVGMGILILLTVYQRTYRMYSRGWLVITILYCCIMVILCYRGEKLPVCIAYAVYFETVYCLDLFLYIGFTTTFLEKNFLRSLFQISVERIVVYLITRIVIALFSVILYKGKVKVAYYFKAGKLVWMVILVAEHTGLILCDKIFISGQEENAADNWKIILLLYPFVVLLLVFYFMKQKYQIMYEQIKIQNALYYNQYEAMEKKSKEKDRIYHDFRNHMIVVRRLVSCGDAIQAQSYIDDLLESSGEECEWRIGHPILDYLLQVKISEAMQRGIQVKERYIYNINQMDEAWIRDWGVLLGNLWDNAIEGCERAGGKKEISFSIEQMGNMVIVKMENTCCSDVNLKKLKTTKTNSEIHGIGLQNIEYVVEKHEGIIKRECKDGIFFIQVTIIE